MKADKEEPSTSRNSISSSDSIVTITTGSALRLMNLFLVEACVVRDLGHDPTLAKEKITPVTSARVVTVSGAVSNTASRDTAGQIVARTPGVAEVIDELVMGHPDVAEASATSEGGPQEESGQDAIQLSRRGSSSQAPVQPVPWEQSQAVPVFDRLSHRHKDVLSADMSVLLLTIDVSVNHWLSSGELRAGASFDGTVVTDINADDAVAIPRGADVQGKVVDSGSAGAVGGRDFYPLSSRA